MAIPGLIKSGAETQAGSPSAETGRMPVLQSAQLLIKPVIPAESRDYRQLVNPDV